MNGYSSQGAYTRQTLDGHADGREGKPPSAKYPHYLPTWDRSLEYPLLEPFEHVEHAVCADPTVPNLISPGVNVNHLTPKTGIELSNVQLGSLSRKGKDQLAHMVAARKVVVLRSQNFRDLAIPEVLEFCKYFGKPTVHPVGPSPKGHPQIHIAHTGGGDTRLGEGASTRTTSMIWHTDCSGELQPAGLVFLYMLECPETGGDTIFCNTAEAYNKLSPAFQERLHGLQAEHSDLNLTESTQKAGGHIKRDGTTSLHPIVRTNPATGEKALFVNSLYTTRIVGYKKEESDALLKFLFDHIAYSQDCQARVRWTEDTVVIFDNRATCHSAIFDFVDHRRRHLARVSLAAEKPFETPFEENIEKSA